MAKIMIKFGLDFGTTNSSISISQDGKVTVLPIDQKALDPRVVRSMLFFFRREMYFDSKVPQSRLESKTFRVEEILYKGDQEYRIGQEAVGCYLQENKNRKPGVKYKILTGKVVVVAAGADPVAEYYEEIDYGTGRLIQALKSSLKTSFQGTAVFGKYFTVEELISIFIKNIKEKAEELLGQKIADINCGRPVQFSEDLEIDQEAEQRLEKALKLAGFENIGFEYEPVAAAKQYTSLNDKKGQVILVFDFGGGTLDTALVKTNQTAEVLATDGVYIGGDLLNADIMQYKLWDYFGASSKYSDDGLRVPTHFYTSLNSWYSIPSLNNPDTMFLLDKLSYKNTDPEALKRLVYLISANVGFEVYEAIERAKKELSFKDETYITYKDGPIDLNIKITRDEFEKIIQSRVEEIREVVLRTLEKAKISPEEVNKVVRTGGSSLIPVFTKMLEDIFGKEKITLFDTFTSIAAGLALE